MIQCVRMWVNQSQISLASERERRIHSNALSNCKSGTNIGNVTQLLFLSLFFFISTKWIFQITFF